MSWAAELALLGALRRAGRSGNFFLLTQRYGAETAFGDAQTTHERDGTAVRRAAPFGLSRAAVDSACSTAQTRMDSCVFLPFVLTGRARKACQPVGLALTLVVRRRSRRQAGLCLIGRDRRPSPPSGSTEGLTAHPDRGAAAVAARGPIGAAADQRASALKRNVDRCCSGLGARFCPARAASGVRQRVYTAPSVSAQSRRDIRRGRRQGRSCRRRERGCRHRAVTLPLRGAQAGT